MENNNTNIKKACVLIERLCRQLGKDCTITFTNEGVSIAPLSWPGESFGETFHDALIDALSNEN
jgi:hypothetical protein